MKKLPVLSSQVSLKGKKVLVRVDWNIPLHKIPEPGDLAKIQQNARTIQDLIKKGAIVILMTHLGRPERNGKNYSTVRLLSYAEAYIERPIMFCGESLIDADGLIATKQCIDNGKPGDVFLLENVRFYEGENKNDKNLAKAYTSLADIYINDAFAFCHRKNASMVAITEYLPHFAGPQLTQEVSSINKIISKPKKPFVALIGGAKLTTKMPVMTALLKKADQILIGGAMAHPFFVAKKQKIGKSFLDKESIAIAKKLLKNKKILLPTDVVVAKKIQHGAKVRCVKLDKIVGNDVIGDIGTQTMREWSQIIKTAQTILWNGPVGVAELPAFSHGSLVLGQAIASKSKGKAYGVVGGGDTVPVAMETGMCEWFDHVSMGGGALLEFIANNGKLPGLTALMSKQLKTKKNVSPIIRKVKPQTVKAKKVVQSKKSRTKKPVKKFVKIKKSSSKKK
ncbi:phosphoglycerate kinase [Patescibacteria group bacterium]|nr:phosphoglycerate kinase [Patescibacteria group bacterium]